MQRFAMVPENLKIFRQLKDVISNSLRADEMLQKTQIYEKVDLGNFTDYLSGAFCAVAICLAEQGQIDEAVDYLEKSAVIIGGFFSVYGYETSLKQLRRGFAEKELYMVIRIIFKLKPELITKKHLKKIEDALLFLKKHRADTIKFLARNIALDLEAYDYLYQNMPMNMYLFDLFNNPGKSVSDVFGEYTVQYTEYFKSDRYIDETELKKLENNEAEQNNYMFKLALNLYNQIPRRFLAFDTHREILLSVCSGNIKSDPLSGKLLQIAHHESGVVIWGYGMNRANDNASEDDISGKFPEKIIQLSGLQ